VIRCYQYGLYGYSCVRVNNHLLPILISDVSISKTAWSLIGGLVVNAGLAADLSVHLSFSLSPFHLIVFEIRSLAAKDMHRRDGGGCTLRSACLTGSDRSSHYSTDDRKQDTTEMKVLQTPLQPQEKDHLKLKLGR